MVRFPRGSTLSQVNFDQDTTGFSSLEMQIRDENSTVRISLTLTPGEWRRDTAVLTSKRETMFRQECGILLVRIDSLLRMGCCAEEVSRSFLCDELVLELAGAMKAQTTLRWSWAASRDSWKSEAYVFSRGEY